MSASYLMPRSSTPKNSSRALPRIPDASKTGTSPTKSGRKLPPIPSIRPFDKTKQGPYPTMSACYTKSQGQQIIQNNPPSSSLPKISRPSRQLPKLPDDIGRRQIPTTKKNPQTNRVEDKKEQLHDLYKEEGDDMYKQAQFDKAVDLYTAALKLVQNNKATYVARSRCYMEMGKTRKAMNDVETALRIDPLFFEALFQKGELLFQEKNFESALVYYNKGMQQRPEMKSFHDRITKTQNAMLKTGSKLTNKLIKSGELSMVLPNKMKPFSTKLSPKSDQASLTSARTTARSTKQRKKNPFIYSTKTKSHNIYQKTDVTDMDNEERRIQEALGQMYNDKEYLERLVQEAEKLSRGSADMCTLAEKGLNFLYDRVLFWVRQENGIPLDTKITLAESIEKQLTGRQVTQPTKFDSGLHVYGNSIPLSGIPQEDLFVQKPMETRKLSTKKDKIQSIRTCNTGFSDVLSGQKVEIMCNGNKKKSGIKPPLSVYGQQQADNVLIQKDVRTTKELDNSNNLSDNDSGINLSFSTCRENSDPDQLDPIQIRTIQEEYLTPIQSPDKKILKQRKNIERRVRLRNDSMSEYIATSLEAIEAAFIGGRYKDCVARARPVLTALNRYNEDCEECLPNSISIEAKLHSYIGNAAIEMRDYPTALHHHQRDLEIGEDCNDEVIVSRALGNLGRIFVFKNKHQEALELFSRKIPLCKSNVETAWLYHEIGNCFLVLSQYAFAKEAARRSIEAADAEEQCSYQLQSCVLKGVAEVKLKEYHAAFNTFERAMKQARRQGDETAEESIREALLDVNERILEEIRAKDQCEERQKSRNSYLASRMMEALPEIRELTSCDIYEDEGPISLTDTRCDTYDLYSEIGPLETGMTGSFPRMRTVSSMSRITPDTRRLSTCNHPQTERDKDRRSVLQPSRSNTVH